MGFWDFIKELLRAVIAAWWHRITEGGSAGPETEPKYAVEYPPEYTRNYFQNGMTNYCWTPLYKGPMNHLYHDGDRFKYRPSKYDI
ncbi:MAG: hypothetical protein ACFFB3_24465 [Candidatus Hodarchaeota archaeon]